MKKGDVKKGANGESYVLVKRLGRGGQAAVWKVVNKKTKKHYAYKEYKRDEYGIKGNIEALIKIGAIKDKNGRVLDSVVLPITTVDCPPEGFGYVMELVDLKDYTTVKKAWAGKSKGKYPSADAICKIVKNFAEVFDALHRSYGLCYKDVNEGNIFFNPQTGDIKIIDNDNIGYPDHFTIKGTSGYMAPEIVLGTKKPDHNSDRFSLAVFVYRLLVGGYPFEGPYVDAYCKAHNVLPDTARKVVFGTDALFTWHPTDTRNCISRLSDGQSRGQAMLWENLPGEIKALFINTFVTNLSEDRRAERATNASWIAAFDKIQRELVTCSRCGKVTFGGVNKCINCFSDSARHGVLIKVLNAGQKSRKMAIYTENGVIVGDKVSKHLSSGALLKVMYHTQKGIVGVKNLSGGKWRVFYPNNTEAECNIGEVVAVKPGMKINIIPKTVQLNIIGVR